MKKLLILIIKTWKVFISPLFGCNCRYYPSCSQYMEQSIEEHGIIRGLYHGILRICRCNSLFEGGHDPIKE